MHSYFVLHRIYESFFKLNPILEEYGYIFQGLDAREFEKTFDRVITMGAVVEDPSDLTGLAFMHPTYDVYTFIDRPMMLLRSIEQNQVRVYKYWMQCGNSKPEGHDYFNDIRTKDEAFVSEFIQILRLYKSGMIQPVMNFYYDIQTKQYGGSGFDIRKKNHSLKEYIIEDDDVPNIYRLLKEGIKVNDLSKIALDSFNLTYSIENMPLRFITLITALESLFNLGRDQISHTVSRHLSVLISSTKEEFYENYKSMKKLYDYRSKIVHGYSVSDNEVREKIASLENFVRQALTKTIRMDISKDDLFRELNAKGF